MLRFLMNRDLVGFLMNRLRVLFMYRVEQKLKADNIRNYASGITCFWCLRAFFKIYFFRNTIRVSTGSDSDQNRYYVGPDLANSIG